MYKVLLEQYATLTLNALLLSSVFFVGIAALAEYIVFRQTANEQFVAVPLVKAMRTGLYVAVGLACLFAVTLLAATPAIGFISLDLGLLVGIIRFGRDRFFPKYDVVLWALVTMALFAALVPAPAARHTAMPTLYAGVALLLLPLLRLTRHYQHRTFVVKFWG